MIAVWKLGLRFEIGSEVSGGGADILEGSATRRGILATPPEVSKVSPILSKDPANTGPSSTHLKMSAAFPDLLLILSEHSPVVPRVSSTLPTLLKVSATFPRGSATLLGDGAGGLKQ